MSYSTQLTSIDNYDVSNIVFGQVQKNKVPDSPLMYQRINISTRNPDGTIGDLILKTPMLFSFGVQESKSMETKEVNGYVMPLCLWDKNNPSAEEKAWTDVFEQICNRCKEYLVENRNEIGKWDLEMNDLKKFNPLHWKRDRATGRIEAGTGPTLYAKLISSKKDGKDNILSIFYDADAETDEPINPISILNKYCHVTAAIKIESIFIGTRISLQVKLWEVEVRLLGGGSRRLLRPDNGNAPNKTLKTYTPSQEPKPMSKASNAAVESVADTELATSEGSISQSEEEDDEYVKKPSPPRKAAASTRGRRKN